MPVEPEFLDEQDASQPVWRIGPRDEPLGWPRWEYAGPDLTFGNRWDDPQGIYRVLYTSEQRLGCFLEVLAFYRPDPLVESGLAQVIENEALPATRPAGHLDAGWSKARKVGLLRVDEGTFARIGSAASLSLMDKDLSSLLIDYGYSHIDAALIRQAAPRSFTQRVSRYVFEQTRRDGGLFAGIYYMSRFGDDIHNYGFFEGPNRSASTRLLEQEIDWQDADLRQAAAMHHITLDD